LLFALAIGAVSGAIGNALFNFVKNAGAAAVDQVIYLHDVHSQK